VRINAPPEKKFLYNIGTFIVWHPFTTWGCFGVVLGAVFLGKHD